MHIPNLEVPPQVDDTSRLDIRPQTINDWLESLPLANPLVAAAEILTKLKQFNRIKISCAKRLQLLETLIPAITNLAGILRKDLVQAPLPLSPKMAEKALLIRDLFQEMAHGYKSVVMELLLTQQRITNPEQVLVPGLYYAMDYLGQLLAECYTVYAPEPAKTWFQIHQLYFCAESCAIAAVPLKKPANQDDPVKNIDNLYRRIALLAIANPYHLMPGEAAKIWTLLERWSQHCTISRSSANLTLAGCFIVNLNGDSPPGYAAKGSSLEKTAEARILDTKAVVTIIKNEVKQHILNKVWDHDKKQTTMGQRALRTLYQRMAKALGDHRQRKFERLPLTDKAILAAGLTASHFLASRGRHFDPEKDEVELRKRLAEARAAMHLLPENDHANWNEIFDPAYLEPLPDKQQSRFAMQTRATGDGDVWDNVYRSTIRWAQQHGQQATNPVTRNTSCKIKNASKGGIALFFCLDINKIQVRVGELISLKIAPSDQEEADVYSISRWDVGAIKWLRILTDNGGLELGIEKLCTNPVPISIKAIHGVGQGSDYSRGLLLQTNDGSNDEPTLITSPSIYDIGSVLLLNLGDKFMRVRLNRVVEETSSFARFAFKTLNELGGNTTREQELKHGQ